LSSLVSSLKDRKTLLTCIGIIVLAIIALVLIFSGGERKGEGERILASKRVKLTAEELAEGAKPVKAPPEKTAKKSTPKKKAAQKVVAKKKVAKKVVAKKKVAPKKLVSKKAAPAGKLAATLPWAINLASFSKASAAKDLAAKLKAAGYNAYTTEFEKDGQLWHRVRIGFYKSREEAIKIASTLSQKKLVRSKPWVVKPQTDEVIKYTK
jgi:cell division septation protein DedD